MVLQVEDTGMGIPADEQERIFSPFFRSTSARRQAVQGTGLGLAIVQTIVERHGGSLAVTSEEGAGTTVTVTLPITPEDALARDVLAAGALADPPAAPSTPLPAVPALTRTIATGTGGFRA